MSTNLAPMVARTTDPMREAVARAAAKAGMTVDAWIARTDQLEEADNSRRRTDQMMRQVPRYRDGVAA